MCWAAAQEWWAQLLVPATQIEANILAVLMEQVRRQPSISPLCASAHIPHAVPLTPCAHLAPFRHARSQHLPLSHLCRSSPPHAQDPDDSVNIVRTLDSFTFRNHLCITFELLSINLYEYIKACNFAGSSLAVIRRIAQQVLVTLRFLGRLNIVHCDLKPENILLRERGRTAIKVIDFGSSCYVDQRLYTYIQSRFYRSPEVILGHPYGPEIDIWSLGCIMAELFTGQPIFPGEDEKEQLAWIMEVLGVPPRSLLEGAPRAHVFFDASGAPLPCPPNSRGRTHRVGASSLQRAMRGCDDALFIDFLQGCLRWDPALRLTPELALQHPWIQGSTGHTPPPSSRLGTSASSLYRESGNKKL